MICWWTQRVRSLAPEGSAIQLRVETEDGAGHDAWEFEVLSGR